MHLHCCILLIFPQVASGYLSAAYQKDVRAYAAMCLTSRAPCVHKAGSAANSKECISVLTRRSDSEAHDLTRTHGACCTRTVRCEWFSFPSVGSWTIV